MTKFDTTNPENNKIRSDLGSDKKGNADLANLRSGYSNNDVIEVRVVGLDTGNKIHIVNTKSDSGKVKIIQTGTDYAVDSIRW